MTGLMVLLVLPVWGSAATDALMHGMWSVGTELQCVSGSSKGQTDKVESIIKKDFDFWIVVAG